MNQPDFLRLLSDIERARLQWERGNHPRARAILQLVASQAGAAAKDPKPISWSDRCGLPDITTAWSRHSRQRIMPK